MSGELELRGTFEKLDEEHRLAFGWASVASKLDGDDGLQKQIVDLQGDVLDLGPLETAIYKYVIESRDADVMHAQDGVGVLVESILFTPEKIEKMGLDPDTVPVGWWVGFKVLDDAVWKAVKAGTLRMFSIRGEGVREEV